MKKIYKIIISTCFVGLIVFPVTVFAAPSSGTSVSNRNMTLNNVWTKAGSPYYITENIELFYGSSLTMEPGTVVTKDPRAVPAPQIVLRDVVLNILGSETDRVTIFDLQNIIVFNSTTTIEFADFRTHFQTFSMDSGKNPVTIASSTFSNPNGSGILVMGSNIKILNSRLENNLSPALWVNASSLTRESVTLMNSVIVNNMEAIRNYSTVPIQAQNNWWGSPEGPNTIAGSKITGPVFYSPWLPMAPSNKPILAKCCSSVLFLPGLEASRLYRPELYDLSENTLWEPNRNADVSKLFLDSNGSSTDTSIYSGDPIGKAFGLFGIYSNFLKLLDNMVAKQTIKEWQSFGYDWRQAIDQVALGPNKKATTTEELIQVVKDLASRSATGKVTLVAHSNGGLVAKYLVKTLHDMKQSDLIDSVVSVAVPNIGTPKALSALLHGDDQGIAKGVILKQSTARELAQNMPSAYSLLPSAAYFSKILGPTIVFASTTDESINNGSYTSVIQSAADQTAYVTDSLRIRRDPEASNLTMPIRGSELLMKYADIVHNVLDPFIWPANITRFAILGWGLDTVKSLYYAGTDHSNVLSNMGDGTVVAKSAVYNSGTTTSINLVEDAKLQKTKIKHDNILQSSTTDSIIEKIVSKDYTDFCAEVAKLGSASCGEPDYSLEKTHLVLSTHSPVELHVYDSEGNHTGIIPTPPESGVEDDVFTFTESNIPESTFEMSGSNSYVYLPDDGKAYTVIVKGNGVGSFDLLAQRQKDFEITDQVVYRGLPVTPFTVATATIAVPVTLLDGNISVSTYATSSDISLDIEGDGSVDLILSPSQIIDPSITLNLLKQTIITLFGTTSSQTTSLLRKISRLESTVNKGSLTNAIRSAKRLERTIESIGHKNGSSLTQSDKDQIISMIDTYIDQLSK